LRFFVGVYALAKRFFQIFISSSEVLPELLGRGIFFALYCGILCIK